MHFNFRDITGNTYGKLKVISFEGMGTHGQSMWECECECGNTTIVRKCALVTGNTVSCGCHGKSGLHKTHGMKKTRLYRCWQSMKTRCTNPNAEGYENYGGRGISVCEEWSDDFSAFAEWALSNEYTDFKTLDRKNNNGNYGPDNCRWATKKEQSNNQRSNRILTINGISLNVQQWADKTGIARTTIQWRANHGITGMHLIKPG